MARWHGVPCSIQLQDINDLGHSKKHYGRPRSTVSCFCNQGVAGSSPAVGTNDFKDLGHPSRSVPVLLRELCGRLLQNPTEDDQFGSSPFVLANLLNGLDESRKLDGRVVCRDPTRSVSEQILPVFEAHSGRPRPAAKNMLQVVDPHLFKISPRTGSFPGRCHHSSYALAAIGKDKITVEAPMTFHHGSSYPVEHHEPFITILDAGSGYYKDRRVQFRNHDLPSPAQRTGLLIATTRINGKQGHVCKVGRQLSKLGELLRPGQRVRLPLVQIRQQLDLGR